MDTMGLHEASAGLHRVHDHTGSCVLEFCQKYTVQARCTTINSHRGYGGGTQWGPRARHRGRTGTRATMALHSVLQVDVDCMCRHHGCASGHCGPTEVKQTMAARAQTTVSRVWALVHDGLCCGHSNVRRRPRKNAGAASPTMGTCRCTGNTTCTAPWMWCCEM